MGNALGPWTRVVGPGSGAKVAVTGTQGRLFDDSGGGEGGIPHERNLNHPRPARSVPAVESALIVGVKTTCVQTCVQTWLKDPLAAKAANN